jgi:orotate phosphoribosyltransferase
MNLFSSEAFNYFCIDNGVVGFFEKPVTLKSGRQSCWYVNWRRAAADVYLIDQLSDFLLAYTKDLVASGKIPSPDCFYGVPEGATKLAVITQFKWAKEKDNLSAGTSSLPMGRAQPKDHGDPADRFFVGAPSGKTVVIEDVTTTGGSLLTALDGLLEAGIDVIAAIGLTNRMERRDDGTSVAEAIAKRHNAREFIPYFALSSAEQLLPAAVKKLKPSSSTIAAIEAHFADYGLIRISL